VFAATARSRSGRWSVAQALSCGKNSQPADSEGNDVSRRFSISVARTPET
jgi:hypothetical protein